jgi:hypothetical protein
MKDGAVPPHRNVRQTRAMFGMLMDHASDPRKIKASMRELRTLRSLREREVPPETGSSPRPILCQATGRFRINGGGLVCAFGSSSKGHQGSLHMAEDANGIRFRTA